MTQAVQLAGALLVLLGFALAQRGVVGQRSPSYLLLNVVGSGALAGTALAARQWGFVLLNVTWLVVAAVGLVALVRRRRVSRG